MVLNICSSNLKDILVISRRPFQLTIWVLLLYAKITILVIVTQGKVSITTMLMRYGGDTNG